MTPIEQGESALARYHAAFDNTLFGEDENSERFWNIWGVLADITHKIADILMSH
jgi:hypothetical protein